MRQRAFDRDERDFRKAFVDMSGGMERRDFLKVLGTAGAGAGLAGCSTAPAEKLIPYMVGEEDIVPGMSTWYRTTCRECPAGCGMSIRTREGRAVKAEGNPLSPISHGRLCPRGQASLHGLYNPDRIPQALVRAGQEWDRIAWADAERRLASALADARGRAVFLTESYPGTMDVLLDEWCAGMGVERVRFDAFALEPVRAGSRMVYGRDVVPRHDLSVAEVVVTFGADFVETWVSPVDYAHGFVQGHAYREGRRGRLIAVGPHQSLTGLNADDWLPARPGTEHLVALAMAKVIADTRGAPAGDAAGLLSGLDLNQAADAAGISPDRIREAAVAFANGGRSAALGPGVASSHRNGTAVAAAVALLNRMAGNVGRTVHLEQPENGASGSYRNLHELLERARRGEVAALLVHGPNPLHSVPLPEDGESVIGQVPFIASFSPFLDETSARAHLLLPDHHFLESWGDHEPRPGVRELVQPVMVPVFYTKQTGDVLLSVARAAGAPLGREANSYYDYLRERWAREVLPGGDFERAWREALQAGVVLTDAAAPVAPAAAAAPGAADAGAAAAPAAGAISELDFAPAAFTGEEEADLYLVVYPSIRFYDGRMANRPWLQELPDPVSKITWGSWVEVNPRTARERGLETGHLVELSTLHGSARLPVWVHPGIRPDTIAVQLGQGHEGFGRYARGRGVNPNRLLAAEVDPHSGGVVWVQARASLRATGEWEKLPLMMGSDDAAARKHVTETFTIEEARAAEPVSLVALAAGRAEGPYQEAHDDAHAQAPPFGSVPHHGPEHPLEATANQLQVTGGFGPVRDMPAGPQDFPQPGTWYGEYSAEQPRWGMAIDMDRCTGCSACMTACYAENNIAMVGPEQHARGRILTWIRIERYTDYDENGEWRNTRFLPMLCQQCGNAPCEPVCPVYASYHTPEGLNAQVYNRCVGTRYCANNCPYKVRYFNYWTAEWPEPLNWQLNPDVTVREKGVMEKCTFCVQRIRDAQRNARVEDRPVVDGEIVPACAQTCPGEAIVFGDMKDPASRVAQVAASGRGYRVLGELNTQSGITYLRQVTLDGSRGDGH